MTAIKYVSYGESGNMYNMLFDMNTHAKAICELLSIEMGEIQRFRDCGIDYEKKTIWIYTRTGSKYSNVYPNITLINHLSFINAIDDTDDKTYALYYFEFPTAQIQKLQNLQKLMKNESNKIPNWKEYFDNFQENFDNNPKAQEQAKNMFSEITKEINKPNNSDDKEV